MLKQSGHQSTLLTRSQSSYLNSATKIAARSVVRSRHGAVIVKGGSVIAVGLNSYTNDPHRFPVNNSGEQKIPHLDRGKQLSIHAELAAIRRVSPNRLKGATIYIARVTRNGELRNSAPCAGCTKELLEAGIKKVIFTE